MHLVILVAFCGIQGATAAVTRRASHELQLHDYRSSSPKPVPESRPDILSSHEDGKNDFQRLSLAKEGDGEKEKKKAVDERQREHSTNENKTSPRKRAGEKEQTSCPFEQSVEKYLPAGFFSLV